MAPCTMKVHGYHIHVRAGELASSTYCPTRPLAYTPTRLIAHSPTRQVAYSPTRLLANSPTRLRSIDQLLHIMQIMSFARPKLVGSMLVLDRSHRPLAG